MIFFFVDGLPSLPPPSLSWTSNQHRNTWPVVPVMQPSGKMSGCSVCGKQFNSQYSLYRHEKIVHKGEKPYQCAICCKAFTTNGNLKVHHRIHTGEKPYECEVCGRTFNQSSTLKTHRLTHDKHSFAVNST